MTPATPADAAEVAAFLTPQAPFAMFALNNLAQYGMQGGHDLAVRFWLRRAAGHITDVMTVCENGMALPFLPTGDFAAAMDAIGDLALIGIIGPRAHVRGCLAQGFAQAPRRLDHDEPHFLLQLDRLTVPDGPGAIYPLAEAPAAVIKGWMHDYEVRSLGTPADKASGVVAASYDRYVASGRYRVLMDGAMPLAMTGFNAQVTDIVQVGGVYTPPELRGRGLARRAVGLHLAQAAGQGITRATLFSGSDMATRAYRAIGFEQIGDWTLLFFDGPQRRDGA